MERAQAIEVLSGLRRNVTIELPAELADLLVHALRDWIARYLNDAITEIESEADHA